jgi:hypothetical protein
MEVGNVKSGFFDDPLTLSNWTSAYQLEKVPQKMSFGMPVCASVHVTNFPIVKRGRTKSLNFSFHISLPSVYVCATHVHTILK